MTPHRERRGLGIALVLASAVLWSAGGVGVKVIDASPLAIAGFRSVFALPIVALALLARARALGAPAWGGLRRPYAPIAAVSYATMVIAFVAATKLTTAANAIFLQYTGPIYVAILSAPLLGERLRQTDWLIVAGCVFGMALFFADTLSVEARWGNLVAIVSSFGFAGVPLTLRMEQVALARAGEHRTSPLGPMLAMVAGNALTIALCLPWMIASRPHGARAWAVLAALGVFQIGLPYVLYAIAVRHLRAIESSLVAMLEPILSPVWVLLATGETPGRMAILGGAVIVMTLSLNATLVNRIGRRRPAGS